MVDTKQNKLRAKIIEKFGTVRNFASAAGFDESYLSLKLRNLREWKLSDIRTITAVLDLTPEELKEIFLV